MIVGIVIFNHFLKHDFLKAVQWTNRGLLSRRIKKIAYTKKRSVK